MLNNFLNAQNYILGKTEKKKLLSKFFVDRFLKTFYNFLNLFYYLISYIFGFLMFLFYFIFLLLLFALILYFYFIGEMLVVWTLIIVSLFFFFNLNLIKTFNDIKINKATKIDSIKTFFSIKSLGIEKYFFGYLIILLLLPFFGLIEYVSFFLFVGMFVNIFSVILFPFFLVVIFFIIIYSTIYVFLIKGTKSYKFLKYKPQTQFLKKFEKIEKDFALNEYYGVKLRK